MANSPVNRRTFLRTAAATAAILPLGIQARGQGGSRKPEGLRFSLAHLTVLGCAPPEMTYIAARAGYDYVSYRLIAMHLPGEPVYDLAGNTAMLRQTRTALAETGLKVHDVELARIQDGIDVKSWLPALETAAELGARQVITSVWTADRKYALESVAALCDEGKKLGLTMNLEFVTWSNVASLREAVGICRSVKRDNLGLLIDTLHFNRSRVPLGELDSAPKEWFHFAHVCDAPGEIPTTSEGLIHTGREERLYPGEGAIDIAAIVNRLPQVPYSLEIPHLARVKELGYAEHAWRCLEAARKYFAAHPRKDKAG
jgi:sugar phosphate isomerase/epimerase